MLHLQHKKVRAQCQHRKVTKSQKSSIEQHWNNVEARRFLHAKHIVNQCDFDMVFWDGVEAAIHNFSKMLETVVTKQTSNVFGTN